MPNGNTGGGLPWFNPFGGGPRKKKPIAGRTNRPVNPVAGVKGLVGDVKGTANQAMANLKQTGSSMRDAAMQMGRGVKKLL